MFRNYKLFLIVLLLFLMFFVLELCTALPTKSDLTAMDYAFQGQPFVEMPSKDSIDLETMDYAFQGQPFVRVYETAPPVGWQHKWNTKTISKWNTKEFTKWDGLE